MGRRIKTGSLIGYLFWKTGRASPGSGPRVRLSAIYGRLDLRIDGKPRLNDNERISRIAMLAFC